MTGLERAAEVVRASMESETSKIVEKIRRDSAILELLTYPGDPRDRRSHLRRSRWLPWRRVLVWDETETEHAERIAKLGPAPVGMVYHYPRMNDRAPGARP